MQRASSSDALVDMFDPELQSVYSRFDYGASLHSPIEFVKSDFMLQADVVAAVPEDFPRISWELYSSSLSRLHPTIAGFAGRLWNNLLLQLLRRDPHRLASRLALHSKDALVRCLGQERVQIPSRHKLVYTLLSVFGAIVSLQELLAGGHKAQLRGKRLSRGIAPETCLLYTSPSPRDQRGSRMPSSA